MQAIPGLRHERDSMVYHKYPAHKRRPGKQKYGLRTKVVAYRSLTPTEEALLAPYLSNKVTKQRARPSW